LIRLSSSLREGDQIAVAKLDRLGRSLGLVAPPRETTIAGRDRNSCSASSSAAVVPITFQWRV
jgi:hypothetical protein